MIKINSSEITPEHVYLSRRKFMVGIGALAAGLAVLTSCKGQQDTGEVGEVTTTVATQPPSSLQQDTGKSTATVAVNSRVGDELSTELTPYEAVTNYNNYYEFSTDKELVAPMAKDFNSSPWTVEVGGLVNKAKTFDIEELLKFTQQERIYRMRCVEGWSMVIPWLGFSLATLLKEVEPTSKARYVRFTTLFDPQRFPGQDSAYSYYNWPYVEGLRLDEAMNDLTLLSTGLYGKNLLPQNGAPIRLVVPWKYGFKSIKSIVKIELVEEMPVSLWMSAGPSEYGFYANVNPEVDHPRWSQSSERRIGEFSRRPTLMFNGYAEEVASLYDGMDLRADF